MLSHCWVWSHCTRPQFWPHLQLKLYRFRFSWCQNPLLTLLMFLTNSHIMSLHSVTDSPNGSFIVAGRVRLSPQGLNCTSTRLNVFLWFEFITSLPRIPESGSRLRTKGIVVRPLVVVCNFFLHLFLHLYSAALDESKCSDGCRSVCVTELATCWSAQIIYMFDWLFSVHKKNKNSHRWNASCYFCINHNLSIQFTCKGFTRKLTSIFEKDKSRCLLCTKKSLCIE